MASVTIKGARKYRKRLADAPKKVEKKARETIVDVGTKIHRQAQQNAPVRDGDLRRGIVFRNHRRDMRVEIASTAPHAAIIEFGGRAGPGRKAVIPARQYFRRAVEAFKREAFRRMGRVFRVV